MKYVIVLLVAAIVLWLLLRRRPRKTARGAAGGGASGGVEDMVVCAHCGVHLPRSEALIADGRAYCGALHRDAGPMHP